MSKLYIISTPIGNLEDITLRAVKTLFSVDILLCEDTRRTGKLLERLKKDPDIAAAFLTAESKQRLISFHEHNSDERIPDVLDYLSWGKEVGLVSNSGTPLISDPGYKLVNACIDEGYKIVPVPGASAITTAVSASGLTPARIFFLGFLSKRKSRKKKLLEKTRDAIDKLAETVSLVIYESPYRLEKTLQLVDQIFANPQVAVCFELTKMHENVLRGKAGDLLQTVAEKKLKGEITLVVELTAQ